MTILLLMTPLIALGATVHAQTVRVCAVQAKLSLYDTSEDFAAHMERLMAQAMECAPQLVVFPEDIATPLVMLGDRELVEGAGGLAEAVQALVGKHAAQIAALMERYRCSPQRALFLLRADEVRGVYVGTFSRLAREHGVTIAAGSVLLPLEGADDGNVYNLMMLFGPDGKLIGKAKKVNPIPLELADGLDIVPAPAEDLRVFDTPAGRLGMLVCADAWDPALAAALKEAGAQILVNCLANPEEWTPPVATNMLSNGLSARVRETGLYGVQAFAVGDLLGLPFRGRSQITAPAAVSPPETVTDGVGVLARAATSDAEEIVCAELDLGR